MSTSEERLACGPASSESASSETDDPDVKERLQEAMEALSQCLKAELTALEGYDLALKHAMHPQVSQALLELRGDHARRTDLLRNRIKGSRSTPNEGMGATGALAELVAASSDAPEDGAAIEALEEFEHRGLELYRDGLTLVDPSTRAFFETVLLPAQQRTHDLCRSLQGYMRQPAS